MSPPPQEVGRSLSVPERDDLINFTQVATLLGTHIGKVRKLARSGVLGQVFKDPMDCRVRLASRKRVVAFFESHVEPIE